MDEIQCPLRDRQSRFLMFMQSRQRRRYWRRGGLACAALAFAIISATCSAMVAKHLVDHSLFATALLRVLHECSHPSGVDVAFLFSGTLMAVLAALGSFWFLLFIVVDILLTRERRMFLKLAGKEMGERQA